MAAATGEYRVSVIHNSEQCDISCDKPCSESITNAYFDASSVPTVTFTFTAKDGYAITDIAIDLCHDITYEIIGGNKVKVTADPTAAGDIQITVTTVEDIKDLSTLFAKIANALRSKKGPTAAIKAVEFPSNINALPVLDTSDATAVAANILSGKTAYAKGVKLTGSIASKGASDLTASGATVTVPAGHYASQAAKSVATAAQATPSISVDAAGKITASATQAAGYVAAGTKSATKQLTVQAAQTITPGTSDKTIAAGKYLTGAQTIKGDTNLRPWNIARGETIFGVDGTHLGLPDLENAIPIEGTCDAGVVTFRFLPSDASIIVSRGGVFGGPVGSAITPSLWAYYFFLAIRGVDGEWYGFYNNGGSGETSAFSLVFGSLNWDSISTHEELQTLELVIDPVAKTQDGGISCVCFI